MTKKVRRRFFDEFKVDAINLVIDQSSPESAWTTALTIEAGGHFASGESISSRR